MEMTLNLMGRRWKRDVASNTSTAGHRRGAHIEYRAGT